jgi:hypothetical protein
MNRTDHALTERVDAFFKERRSPNMRPASVVCKDISVDEEARTIDGVISTEQVDRDGEVILTRGIKLERYRGNPVVFFMHDPWSIIAKCNDGPKVRRRSGVNQLVGKAAFADTALANEVFSLATGEFLRGISIGMLPSSMSVREPRPDELRKDNFKGARAVIDKSEMIEFSFVSIPANAEALTTAMTKGLIRVTEPYYEPFLRVVTDANPRKRPFLRVTAVPEPVVKAKEVPPWGRVRPVRVTEREIIRRVKWAEGYEAGRI